jgi:hypothetical protein
MAVSGLWAKEGQGYGLWAMAVYMYESLGYGLRKGRAMGYGLWQSVSCEL